MVEPDAKAVAFLKNMRVLETQRGVWEAHWQEIADYVVPRKADITKRRTAGEKRTQLIYDGTAIHALELLSSSLHGMLTSASTAWFTLGFSDPALNRDDKAKEWLEAATDSLYDAFDRSNFQEQVQELYQDLVAFGTGCMFVESAEPAGLRFSVASGSSGVLTAAVARYRKIMFAWGSGEGVQQVAGPELAAVTISVADGDDRAMQLGADESYILTIPATAAATASLTANTTWGSLRGLETLSQLV